MIIIISSIYRKTNQVLNMCKIQV